MKIVHAWDSAPPGDVPLNYRAKINRLSDDGLLGDREGVHVINVNHNNAPERRRARHQLPPDTIMVEVTHQPGCVCWKGPMRVGPLEVSFACDCDPDVQIVRPLP